MSTYQPFIPNYSAQKTNSLPTKNYLPKPTNHFRTSLLHFNKATYFSKKIILKKITQQKMAHYFLFMRYLNPTISHLHPSKISKLKNFNYWHKFQLLDVFSCRSCRRDAVSRSLKRSRLLTNENRSGGNTFCFHFVEN